MGELAPGSSEGPPGRQPPSYCTPLEDFAYDPEMDDWKCLLCDKWADQWHVEGKDHREAVRSKNVKAGDAVRMQRTLDAARSRRKYQQKIVPHLKVLGISADGRHFFCHKCDSGGNKSETSQPQQLVPLDAFEEWPLHPRPGDRLAPRTGSSPVRLVDSPAILDSEETIRFVEAFAERVAANGPVIVCSEMLSRYYGYMQAILQDFKLDDLDQTFRVISPLIRVLETILREERCYGQKSAALTFLLDALRSNLIRRTLPTMLSTSAMDCRQIFEFAALVAERNLKRFAMLALCLKQPHLHDRLKALPLEVRTQIWNACLE
eukprot:TRINITY_DN68929_c0_g1_i1.p1 TRINITY_DN68929_c0_g1~~TRINITY_DN68929_c0_g1_i1.p1  ORF type:complete len:337 (-),score=39.57 TRINITY_DN68929_c0_g1_i1:6-965(-)